MSKFIIENIKAFSQVQINQLFKTNKITYFIPKQMQAFTPKQIQAFTTGQIKMLSPEQIQAFIP